MLAVEVRWTEREKAMPPLGRPSTRPREPRPRLTGEWPGPPCAQLSCMDCCAGKKAEMEWEIVRMWEAGSRTR